MNLPSVPSVVGGIVGVLARALAAVATFFARASAWLVRKRLDRDPALAALVAADERQKEHRAAAVREAVTPIAHRLPRRRFLPVAEGSALPPRRVRGGRYLGSRFLRGNVTSVEASPYEPPAIIPNSVHNIGRQE